MPADPASAARRVAEPMTMQDGADFLRAYAASAERCGDASKLAWSIRALLPVLDAVAGSGSDAARVERWARGLCSAAGLGPDTPSPDIKGPCWLLYETDAKRAIALADAERAAARLAHDALAS